MISGKRFAKHPLQSLAAAIALCALVLALGACSSLSRSRTDEASRSQTASQTPSPKAGDDAPDVALLDASSDRIIKLSDYRGQVVFMEFWSSVSAPCLNAIADCDLLAIRHKTDWASKAVIVGVSLDDKREVLQENLRLNRWTHMPQLWAAIPSPGSNSTAKRTYNVTTLPTAFLVSPDGRILWRGHPKEINIEREIAKLISK